MRERRRSVVTEERRRAGRKDERDFVSELPTRHTRTLGFRPSCRTSDDRMGALGFARYALRLGRSPNAKDCGKRNPLESRRRFDERAHAQFGRSKSCRFGRTACAFGVGLAGRHGGLRTGQADARHCQTHCGFSLLGSAGSRRGVSMAGRISAQHAHPDARPGQFSGHPPAGKVYRFAVADRRLRHGWVAAYRPKDRSETQS
jgi:hypothetical protein